EQVPSVRAIKDWAGNIPQHEMHIRTLQTLPRPVNVLTTHSAWLLSSLVLGCNGLLSGSGSVIPDLQAELFHAVQTKNLGEAQRLNDRIYPLARAFYADPWADMHNRMKEALVLLDRLPRAVVRPPLVKLAPQRARAAMRPDGQWRRGMPRAPTKLFPTEIGEHHEPKSWHTKSRRQPPHCMAEPADGCQRGDLDRR
ncbi:MAG: dihydrodipicolinate synthase family protein, partial [Alphaproteobacteria bacterium]